MAKECETARRARSPRVSPIGYRTGFAMVPLCVVRTWLILCAAGMEGGREGEKDARLSGLTAADGRRVGLMVALEGNLRCC